jgi:hypothetical protein
MAKTRQTRGEVRDRKLITELEKNIKINFGSKCADHEEECCVCEIYKALNTIQRLYDYKETN